MRVLIAEDDPVSRRVLESFLKRWGHETIPTKDGAEALAHLDGPDAPRLAILDWMMPELDGLEVCRRARQREDAPFTYIILLTAKGEIDDIVTALDAGADDYLVKPYQSAELRSRIGAGERIVSLHLQLEALNDRLRTMALTDSLTQLANRNAIMQRLAEEVARARRDAKALAVFMLDVDHFKKVNDTYGHQVGDEVLRAVAARLARQCRAYDAVGRYGGEEFIAIMPGPDLDQTAGIGERIRASVADEAIPSAAGDLAVTISVGGAYACPGPETTVDLLIQKADAALYAAKEGGRNRVVITPLDGGASPG